MPNNSYLVTGAAGFIGSHSVDRLLAQGCRVIGVDSLRTGRVENLAGAMQNANFQFLELDIRDAAGLTVLFERARADGAPLAGVLHLAALVSVPESVADPFLNAELNLLATDQIARLCVAQKCPRLVFASSAAIYGDAEDLPNRETQIPRPLSPYAGAKLAGEAMLSSYSAAFGLQTTVLRYFNVYGPRQDPGSPYSGVLSVFTRRFLDKKVVNVNGDGEQTRDFVAVVDVAEANVRALTAADSHSGVYNVCTGHSISLNQVLAVYRERFPEAEAVHYGPAREGDVRHSLGDPGCLQSRFGWVPNTPFKTGLAALLDATDPPATQ